VTRPGDWWPATISFIRCALQFVTEQTRDQWLDVLRLTEAITFSLSEVSASLVNSAVPPAEGVITPLTPCGGQEDQKK
jgi:hypothetical protein